MRVHSIISRFEPGNNSGSMAPNAEPIAYLRGNSHSPRPIVRGTLTEFSSAFVSVCISGLRDIIEPPPDPATTEKALTDLLESLVPADVAASSSSAAFANSIARNNLNFTQTSDLDVQSCIIEYKHPNNNVGFTLYPMLHVAEKSFYDAIFQDLQNFDYILHEGSVLTMPGEKPKPLYDWCANSLGLANQRQDLKMPDAVEKIVIDMPPEEFHSQFIKLPLSSRTELNSLRSSLKTAAESPESDRIFRFSNINEASASIGSRTPLFKLITDERNKHINEKIHDFVEKHADQDRKISAAVLFGTKHMPSISQGLRKMGYVPNPQKWIKVVNRTPNN